MLRRASPQVVVAGASPTGLFAALCLSRERISVQVLDSRDLEREAASSAPGAGADVVVLAPSTLTLLQEEGLAAPVLEAAQRVERVALHAGAAPVAELSFAQLAADGTRFPYLAILSSARLTEILTTALGREQVEVVPHRRLALLEQGQARVRLTVEQLGKDSVGYAVAHSELVVEKAEELETKYVLVTDGQAAAARAQLRLALSEARPAETYVEVEGQAQRPVPAALRVDPDASSAVWPLSDAGYHGLFGQSEGDPDVSDGAQLAARLPGLPGAVLRAPSKFRVSYYSVAPCGVGRIWLAGGAAHSTSPLASQSLNAGLWEARQLARIFAHALRQVDPRHALARHQRQRAEEWQRLLGGVGLRALEGANAAVARHARRILPCLPARGAELDALLAQLRLEWCPRS